MEAFRAGIRSQSAMEYLMTYGWAILAIAIVMVSLYSLGIFNSGSLQPTAAPGSCEIVRTTAQASLAGQCNNLMPKYVSRLNGANSNIISTNKITFTSTSPWSISVWINVAKFSCSGSYWAGIVAIDSLNRVSIDEDCRNSNEITTWVYGVTEGGFPGAASSLSSGKWYNYIATYDGNTHYIFYLNGKQVGAATDSASYSGSGYANIGYESFSSLYLNGSVANIQVYNASLDNISAKALYQGGVGGVPVDVRHLTAWWPLNGNANDYSGNNNQGTVSGQVVWNANWQSGYTAPSS
ncbi:MAG: LamG domain-containing protein [Candidatus Micrarchaeota archaeon]|nr:LamG domain-containing protein [Candidatus Micrarchaeota archaeon]